MTNPVPGYKVSTAYKKKGSYWKACGWHTGQDYAAPKGTPVVAARSGKVKHTSYGSAFGAKQFAIVASDGSEDFYAHTSTRPVNGKVVQAGQKVAVVGALGNVTGPHLHFERHKKAGTWNCANMDDPMKSHNAGTSSGGGGSSLPAGNVYLSKLVFGQKDSDSVKRLQDVLNKHKLTGGATLPVTGLYGEMTDAEVIKCQKQHGYGNDAPRTSNVGPKQADHLFAGSGHTVINDLAPVEPPKPPPPTTDFQPKTGTVLGKWLTDLGYVVDDSNVSIGRASTWSGVKFLMVHHSGSSANSTPAGVAAWCRTGNEDAPLCQILVDQTGKIWMCSYERPGQPDPGRASHAGAGKGFGIPDDKMNEVSLGIEFLCTGTKPLSDYPTMYAVGIKLLADLRRRYSVPAANVIGHKEWSTTGKKDPLDDMGKIRADVEAVLNPPKPPVDPEIPVTTPRAVYVYTGKPTKAQTLGTSYVKVTDGNFTPPGDGFMISMVYLNLAHTFKSGVDTAGVRVRAIRDTPPELDMTAYQDYLVGKNLTAPGAFLITHIWFGAATKGRKVWWEVDRASQFASMSAGTRYTKWLWVSKEMLTGAAKPLSARQMLTLVDMWENPPATDAPMEMVFW